MKRLLHSTKVGHTENVPFKTNFLKRKSAALLLLFNAFLFTSFAQPGEYLNFDGNDDIITIGSPSSIPIGNDNYTIEAWINTSVISSSQGYGIVGWGNYGAANQCNALKITSTGITNYWWGGGVNDLSVNYSFATGTWYHVAATYDGTTKRIFINGELVGSNVPNANSHNVPSMNNFRIGQTYAGEYFNGGIEEVRIWNSAQTQADIARRRFCELNGTEANLIAYYKFNQGTSGGANGTIVSLTNSTFYSNSGSFSNFNLYGTTSNFLAGSPVTSGSIVPSTPPTLPNTQPSTSLNTVGDLTPAPSSTINWFNTVAGGSALAASTPLVCGTTYYVATVNANGCESARVAYYHSEMEAPADITVCGGQNTSVAFTNTCASTFIWTNDNTSIGLPASGTGSISTFQPTNTTSSAIQATISVTPNLIVPADTTVTFDGIPNEQTWVVPAGINLIHITAKGAKGHNNSGYVGYTTGDLNVTPGQTLYIYAGTSGTGPSSTASFNGGSYTGGAAGGGAADLRVGGNALTDRVIVAYGSGGGGSFAWGGYPEDGGHASATAGGNGGGGTSWGSFGTLGMGGAAAIGSGAGGGGYYGGGGGGDNPGPFNNGAGGNGSNYIGGVTNAYTGATPPTASGHGYVTITYATSTTIPGTAKTFTITVNPSAAISIVSSDIDNSICTDEAVTFTASATNVGTSPAYSWALNGSQIAGQTGLTFTTSTLTNSDAITCELTSTASTCTGNATSNSITTTVNTETTSTTTINSNAASYTWTNGVSYTASGTYSQTLINAAGCDSIATLNLTLSDLGIADVSLNQVQMYPNPTQKNVSFIFDDFNNVSIQILDLNGKLVVTTNEVKSGEPLSVESLQNGVYLIRILTEKGNYTQRLVKQ